MKIYVSVEGKPHFHVGNIFSHCPQSVLYNAWTEIMFPSVKRKTAGDIIYPQCFFKFSRVKKYSLLGSRKTRKTSGMWKETKRTPSPPTSVQLIYSITNIVGGGKIQRVELRTLQYYHPILKMKQYYQLLIFTHEKYNYRQLKLAV